MTELQHQLEKPDLYERLIERLGLALDMAKTAVRLRNEHPAELELRGLSYAEFRLIEAYLGRTETGQHEEVLKADSGRTSCSQEPAARVPGSRHSTNVIWLKDQRRAKLSAKLGRYISGKNFRR